MQRSAIRNRVKEILARIGRFDSQTIGDRASFRRDLGLDSLSLLEAGVDVDYAFQLQEPELEERLQGVDNVDELVSLVEELLAARGRSVA